MHDIIGQRISKIVRTINAVEGTLNSLVVTLGDGGAMGVGSALTRINTLDGNLELEGPALAGQGMEQRDVDRLFEPPRSAARK